MLMHSSKGRPLAPERNSKRVLDQVDPIGIRHNHLFKINNCTMCDEPRVSHIGGTEQLRNVTICHDRKKVSNKSPLACKVVKKY